VHIRVFVSISALDRPEFDRTQGPLNVCVCVCVCVCYSAQNMYAFLPMDVHPAEVLLLFSLETSITIHLDVNP